MMTIDPTIVATALPALQKDLNTSLSWLGWTLTAYSLGSVIMLPLSAKLSIRYGHRRIFVTSVFVFTLASLFCGLANNIYFLIVMRIVQAMGGAGITPSATGIIVNHFGRTRAQYLGLFGSMFAIGMMIGPIFGGIIVTYLSWPWIFFINLPLGILSVIFAFRLIPKDVFKKSTKVKMDFKGLVIMGIAILSAMYASVYFSQHPENIFSSVFIGLILLAGISFFILIRHLRRSLHPFIHPNLIEGKGFGAVNLVNLIYGGMNIGLLSLVPLYAVNRYSLSELNSGMLLVTNGIASVILSIILSIYIKKTGYKLPIYIGSGLLAIGLSLLYLPPFFNMNPFWWLALATFFIGMGTGIMSPASRNAGIQLAPDQSANIAAVRSLAMQMGQIMSITLATAILTGAGNIITAHSFIYLAMAVILILFSPMISRIPESKGGWELKLFVIPELLYLFVEGVFSFYSVFDIEHRPERLKRRLLK